MKKVRVSSLLLAVALMLAACGAGGGPRSGGLDIGPLSGLAGGVELTELPIKSYQDYDLTRDGQPDRLDLLEYRDGDETPMSWVLRMPDGQGGALWEDSASSAHVGWNAVFACSVDGQDCLLRYRPTMYQGVCSYAYRLFYLSEAGEEIPIRENGVDFDVNFGSEVHESFDAAAIAAFLEEVHGYLDGSVLLLSTAGGDPQFGSEGRDFQGDILSNIASVCGSYDTGKSLEENLLAYQAAMERPSLAQPGQFVFTRENFPRLNGSTSTVPLGQAIASVLLGESREDVADLIQFSKTTQSYRELLEGVSELLIAAEPAQVIWEEKEEAGFAWKMEPFAIDALVFLVNADNPVDSLTTEQIQKIYTGQITNWAQVGGRDQAIVPFQRNPEAGSQTAMQKLVMGDLPMMDAPADYVRGEMGDLIEAVASYDGSAEAIGYTVYYYAHDMQMAEGLKLLAVDGAAPNDSTIRSREYPFLNNYYVVAPAQPTEAAGILYDWLLSGEGQRLVAHEGYVSVSGAEAAQ